MLPLPYVEVIRMFQEEGFECLTVSNPKLAVGRMAQGKV
jgi:hypothetical protein